MIKRKDLVLGTPVKLKMTLKYSRDNGWQTTSGHLMQNSIEQGTIMKFHASVDDAVEISYFHLGNRFTTYVHWKDLQISEEISKVDPKPIFFDIKNLDI